MKLTGSIKLTPSENVLLWMGYRVIPLDDLFAYSMIWAHYRKRGDAKAQSK